MAETHSTVRKYAIVKPALFGPTRFYWTTSKKWDVDPNQARIYTILHLARREAARVGGTLVGVVVKIG